MGICDDVCLCAVWTPPHNSMQPIFISLYRSWCRAMWTDHETDTETDNDTDKTDAVPNENQTTSA